MSQKHIIDNEDSYLTFDKEEGKLSFGNRSYNIDSWGECEIDSILHHKLYMQLKEYWEAQ